MKAEILEKAKSCCRGAGRGEASVWAEDVERYICAFCGVGEIPKGCETAAAGCGGGDGRERGEGALKSHHKGGFQRILRAGAESGAFRF